MAAGCGFWRGRGLICGEKRRERSRNELERLNNSHNSCLGCEKRLNFETFEGYELSLLSLVITASYVRIERLFKTFRRNEPLQGLWRGCFARLCQPVFLINCSGRAAFSALPFRRSPELVRNPR